MCWQCHINQHCELSMVNAVYSCKVARVDSQDGCPLQPGSTLNKTVMLKPLAQNCQAIRGLCMDAALSKVQAFLILPKCCEGQCFLSGY